MRLQSHANKLETNVQAESQNFGIGDASVVIEILRNRLYEHKIRTSVQEYMCNARDAMREVGNLNPIQVTMPTRFSSTFKVRDFGPGITPDRMQHVFVMYGASTKRKDNSQTGGFGIGAKSAWSYTDSFTIVTYVDGVKRTYVAHTGVNNNGRLDLISTDSTSEANGTEIQIAVKPEDVGEFVNSALRASHFWEVKPDFKGFKGEVERTKGINVVNGLEIVRGGLPDFLSIQHNYGVRVGLVIDGVPYALGDRLVEKCKGLYNLCKLIRSFGLIHIPNGTVEVSASREAVADSDFTIKNLDAIAVEMHRALKQYILGEFGKVKEVGEFLTTYSEMSKPFNLDCVPMQFKGYSVHNDSAFSSELFKKVSLIRYNYKHSWRSNSTPTKLQSDDKLNRLDFKDLGRIFTAKSDDSLIRRNKRIREMLNSGVQSLVMLEVKDGDRASFDTLVTDLKAKVLNIELPEAPKLPKAAKVKREDTEFCLHVFSGDRYAYTTLASNDKTWLYVPVIDGGYQGYKPEELRELHWYVRDLGLNVCGLAPRAMRMIQKDSNFTPLADWIKAFKPTDKDLAKLKKASQKNESRVDVLRAAIKHLKHGLKDKTLNAIVKEYDSFKQPSEPIASTLIVELIKATKEFKEFLTSDAEFGKLVESTYSLIDSLDYNAKSAEVAFYLDAKYADNK